MRWPISKNQNRCGFSDKVCKSNPRHISTFPACTYFLWTQFFLIEIASTQLWRQRLIWSKEKTKLLFCCIWQKFCQYKRVIGSLKQVTFHHLVKFNIPNYFVYYLAWILGLYLLLVGIWSRNPNMEKMAIYIWVLQ